MINSEFIVYKKIKNRFMLCHMRIVQQPGLQYKLYVHVQFCITVVYSTVYCMSNLVLVCISLRISK